MDRYKSLDWFARFRSPSCRLAAEIAFGIGCSIVMIGVRAVVDLWAPHAGPFALMYPTVMVATLFAGIAGGATAYAVSLLWAWYFALPPGGSFELSNPGDPARLIVNALSAGGVLAMSELFRRAMLHSQTLMHGEIARRAMLLREVNHRTRNNFALVVSLLRLQRREARDPDHAADLEKAVRRVHSFAAAYSLLADDDDNPDALVDVALYLDQLTDQLLPALLPAGVSVEREFRPMWLPRERAVAVGLTLNEAVTNAAKYAFAEGTGRLVIRFAQHGGDWCLTVEDSGGAVPHAPGSGIGSGLMAAFADQAQARLERRFTERGLTVELCGAL